MSNWKQILSWSDVNTLPYREGDTNLNKFMSLVLQEIRKLGYVRYVDPEQLSEFIYGAYEDDAIEEDDYISNVMSLLFTTPQAEAEGLAESYVELYSREEEDFE